MQINSFKLYILILILTISQSLINATTIFYLDSLAIILIILLLEDNYSLSNLLLISLIADLIGHWYLGSHLLATILLSFLSKYLITFYKGSSIIQKNFVIDIVYSLFLIILSIIGLVTHSFNFSWINYLIEIIILVPIILWIFKRFIIKIPPDIII